MTERKHFEALLDDYLRKYIPYLEGNGDVAGVTQARAAVLQAYDEAAGREVEQEECGWLLERPGPEYRGAGDWWDRDSTKAVRFARRHDAEQVRVYLLASGKIGDEVKVTEHIWIDGERDFAGEALSRFENALTHPAPKAEEPTTGNWINADDVLRLTKQLDVALNGEHEGMATRPALCDVVAQARAEARIRGPLLRALPSAELERDAGRWAFLRDHGHEFIDGITLHAWVGANRLRCGGWDKTIDAARAKEAKRQEVGRSTYETDEIRQHRNIIDAKWEKP